MRERKLTDACIYGFTLGDGGCGNDDNGQSGEKKMFHHS
jgi:hypothetical protein